MSWTTRPRCAIAPSQTLKDGTKVKRTPRTAKSCHSRSAVDREHRRRSTLQQSKMVWRKQPQRLPGRCAEHRRHLDGRPGLRPRGYVRRTDQDADAHAALRTEGISVQHVPYDGDLLADARLAADRSQPPARRLRNDRRARLDFDGYTGVIPRTSATMAKVLGSYGYGTAAIGKWHNTPATETTSAGTVHAMADRRGDRLRLLLRLPRRARRRSGSRGCSKTSRRSSRRKRRDRTI